MTDKLALTLPGNHVINDPTNFAFANGTVTDIVSSLLPYVFILAGLILFIFLILSGFELLTSSGDPKRTEMARSRLTNAIVGFIIIFVAYWLARILETVLGITILG